jgi:hypothetical protein
VQYGKFQDLNADLDNAIYGPVNMLMARALQFYHSTKNTLSVLYIMN